MAWQAIGNDKTSDPYFNLSEDQRAVYWQTYEDLMSQADPSEPFQSRVERVYVASMSAALTSLPFTNDSDGNMVSTEKIRLHRQKKEARRRDAPYHELSDCEKRALFLDHKQTYICIKVDSDVDLQEFCHDIRAYMEYYKKQEENTAQLSLFNQLPVAEPLTVEILEKAFVQFKNDTEHNEFRANARRTIDSLNRQAFGIPLTDEELQNYLNHKWYATDKDGRLQIVDPNVAPPKCDYGDASEKMHGAATEVLNQAVEEASPLSVCCQAPTFIDGSRRVCEKCRLSKSI